VNGLSQEIFQLGVNEKYEFRWTEQAQDNARKFGDFAAELDRVIGDEWRDLKSLADGVKTRLEKVPLSKYPPSFGKKGYHTLWAIRSGIFAPAEVACDVNKYISNIHAVQQLLFLIRVW
jgi:DNA primase